ncbi:4,5-DOPA dioxygenase extradiol [Rosenbergiella sp. S61]|uniref:4,5-DOPA dioxygenase extradiol n=1 Tax=Rosenbergiella gaditana TaxID=2726987 RepID=A0ABS5T0M3_9GAMM|nr:4,5-DOPA dioxygenase extradiol [Rosenbergiella gaditana]MBT0725012.1 4,5-DOPA dioxygenase extradiol [Rosenbergiella gaditana]
MTQRMPALFLGHGNPMHAIQENRYTEVWRQLGEQLPRPKAILVISAHWVTQGTAVTAMTHPRTIHDFGQFPQALFDVQYPAAGDPQLAERVKQRLSGSNVMLDHQWGLDHGTWGVLVKMYPDADIPVVQLSLDAALSPEGHYQRGEQLSSLRDEGILLLASGNTVHNLSMARWGKEGGIYPWAEAFDQRVQDSLCSETGDSHHQLVDYQQLPGAQLANPTPEHFLPLLYILGAAHADDTISVPVTGMDMGSISMTSILVQ